MEDVLLFVKGSLSYGTNSRPYKRQQHVWRLAAKHRTVQDATSPSQRDIGRSYLNRCPRSRK